MLNLSNSHIHHSSVKRGSESLDSACSCGCFSVPTHLSQWPGHYQSLMKSWSCDSGSGAETVISDVSCSRELLLVTNTNKQTADYREEDQLWGFLSSTVQMIINPEGQITLRLLKQELRQTSAVIHFWLMCSFIFSFCKHRVRLCFYILTCWVNQCYEDESCVWLIISLPAPPCQLTTLCQCLSLRTTDSLSLQTSTFWSVVNTGSRRSKLSH